MDYILGIDISTSEDYSCITMKCTNCNTIIDSQLFTGEQSYGFKIPPYCPICNIKLKHGVIAE